MFLTVRSSHDLCAAVAAATETGVSWRVIGAASNLLVADEGVDGLVIKPMTRGLRVVPSAAGGGVLIHADAGCVLATVAKKAAFAGLGGLEWAVSVPGTVGASVVNNSGAFGSSVSECLVEAMLFFPGHGERLVSVNDLQYAYRTSRLKKGEWSAVVLEATFRTRRANPAQLRVSLEELEEKRRVTQPFGPSVGSVFRNPEGSYAGVLIEQAGLKGTRLGDAQISPVHANFILNVGRASAHDVLELIRQAQRNVWEHNQVWLTPEIEFVGRWPSEQLATLQGPGTT